MKHTDKRNEKGKQNKKVPLHKPTYTDKKKNKGNVSVCEKTQTQNGDWAAFYEEPTPPKTHSHGISSHTVWEKLGVKDRARTAAVPEAVVWISLQLGGNGLRDRLGTFKCAGSAVTDTLGGLKCVPRARTMSSACLKKQNISKYGSGVSQTVARDLKTGRLWFWRFYVIALP